MGSTSPGPRIDAETLAGIAEAKRLVGRNSTKADVVVYFHEGVGVALKDYSARHWLVRQTLGRWLTGREAAAYAAAAGVPGVVRSYGRVGPFGLALEWIDGETLADARARGVSTDPLPAIRITIARLHDRGIALGDLHHRDVLLARDGAVYVVDLATAWLAGPDARGLRRWIFERFRDADHVAFARLEARIAGRDVDAAVAAVGPQAAAWHRRGRRLKGWLGRTPKLLALFLPFGALMLAARPTPASVGLGAAIVALGEGLRCWAAGYLKKTVDLVTSGPYRHTRNPLYLGRLLIFTGFAVMATLPYHANAVAALVGYGFFFGVYLPRKERVEPTRLRETHGERYEHYFQAVPALWPRWTPYAGGEPANWSWPRFIRNREHWMVVVLTLTALLMLSRT